MAEKIKVCNFDKKQRTKTNINLRKLLHVKRKLFLSEKKNQGPKNHENKA